MCFFCGISPLPAVKGAHEGEAAFIAPPSAATQTPTNDGTPTNGANPYIDSLVWGNAMWTSSAGDPIRYWFGTGTAPDPDGSTPVAADAWSASEIAAFEAAFANYSSVANLFFAPAASQATADIIQWQVPNGTWSVSGVAGQHDVPTGSPTQLNGWYNYQGSYWADLGFGTFGYNLILHELGHGMGLAHPHDGGGSFDGNVFPGVSGSSSTGTNQLNQGIWTVMSYVDGWSTVAPASGNASGHAMSLMAFDIAALQAIYGANTTYNTGSQTYALDDSLGAGTGWFCIWDAGGTDTITNEGRAVGSTIDLRAAPLDGSVNAAGFVSRVNGINGGFTIANGALIENAIGGNAVDTINGNQGANNIQGRDGNDILNGGSGNDTIFGEGGADEIRGDYVTGIVGGGPSGVGSSQPDTVVLAQSSTHTSAANAYNVTNAFSSDADADIANATTIPHTTVEATGNGALHWYRLDIARAGVAITVDIDRTAPSLDTYIQLRAADGTTVLTFNDDSATSSGAGGSTNGFDSFFQYTTLGSGTFYVVVGAYAASSPPAVLGAGLAYEVNISVADAPGVAQPGDGGTAGVDSMYGGQGDDTIWYSPEDAVIDGGTGFDTARAVGDAGLAIRMDAWNIEQLFAGNGNDNIFTFGTAAYNVDGGGGNDSISGNVFGDVLGGNAGNDVIVGFAGNDTLGGGAGSDRLMGMEGADTLFGEGDPDSYIYRGLIDAGDTIIGFETAALRGANGDKLEIQRAGFMDPSQWNAGALDPNRFVAGPATLATGQFLFDTNTGRLFWDGDGTGAGFAQLLLTVQGVNNLTAADFVLV